MKEGCKVLGALKSVMRCRTLGMEAKRGLYEGVVLPTVLYGAETWGGESRREEKVECFRNEMFEEHGWSDVERQDQ